MHLRIEEVTVSSKLLSAAGWSFVGAGLVLPFSTALLNIFCLLGTVLWLLSGKCIQQIRQCIKSPLFILLFTFISILILSLLWAIAPLEESLFYLKKYRKLLYFFPIFCLCYSAPVWRERFLNVLWGSSLLLCVGSVCVALGVPGFPEPDLYQGAIVVKNHIAQGVLMGVSVVLSLRMFLFPKNQKLKFLGLLGAILGVFVAFYLINGRTGYLAVGVALASLILLAPLTMKQRFWSSVIVLVVLCGVLMTSDAFQSRMTKGLQEMDRSTEVTSIVKGDNQTSMGLRMLFWTNGIQIVKENPLLGKGVGSWETAVRLQQEKMGIVKGDSRYLGRSRNAHQDYLMFASQVGLVGLILWLAFLVALFKGAGTLGQEGAFLLRSFVLMYLAGACFNSFMLDITEGTAFILLFGLMGAGILSARKEYLKES